VTTKEYPPEDLEAFRKANAQKAGLAANAKEILQAIAEMPDAMRKLGPVQLFTWLGLFCMWLYFPVAVAHNVFGASDPASPLYKAGVEWGGICFAVYSAVCFGFSFVRRRWRESWGANTPTRFALCAARWD
jgi:maltose/moltooligosaccharide transporter